MDFLVNKPQFNTSTILPGDAYRIKSLRYVEELPSQDINAIVLKVEPLSIRVVIVELVHDNWGEERKDRSYEYHIETLPVSYFSDGYLIMTELIEKE